MAEGDDAIIMNGRALHGKRMTVRPGQRTVTRTINGIRYTYTRTARTMPDPDDHRITLAVFNLTETIDAKGQRGTR